MDFDTTYDVRVEGMGGWFSKITKKACPSNGIANRLNGQANDARKQREEFGRKYEALRNSPQQHEIQQYEAIEKKKKEDIKKLKITLSQTHEIAKVQGLGIWCQKAEKRRKDAERNLQKEQRLLGEAKQKYEHQMDRHKNYLPLLRKRVDSLNAEIKNITTEIQATKQRIEDKKKAELLRKQAEQLRLEQERLKAEAIKKAKKGGSGNMLLLLGIGGLALYYMKKNSKTTKTKTVIKKKTV